MEQSVFQSLLDPCPLDGATGQNLEYDNRYLAMCDAAESTPERQYGDTLVAEKEPDWQALVRSAVVLAQETRDLRVAISIAEGLCRLEGIAGLKQGLKLVEHWTTQHWADVYPQLDAADNNDPMARVSLLNRLSHPQYLLQGILRLTIVEHPSLGKLTLRDLRSIAAGNEDSANYLTRTEVEAILLSSDQAQLRQIGDQLQACVDSVERLHSFVETQIGVGQWDIAPLLSALRDCLEPIENAYGHRAGAVHCTEPAQNPSASPASEQTSTNNPTLLQLATSSMPVSSAFRIETRADAMAVLESLCVYFRNHEPASPVPLLLQRAKRLIPMSFVDILRELAPDGVQQALQSVGAVNEGR